MTDQVIKGHHVAMMFGAAFSVIIGVNVLMAVKAVETFPGLETKNSYVASQSFDAQRRAQEALGWTLDATLSDGRLTLRFDDARGPVQPRISKATLGRATNVAEDRTPEFTWTGEAFTADLADLPGGRWTLWIEAEAANGTPFRQMIGLENRG